MKHQAPQIFIDTYSDGAPLVFSLGTMTQAEDVAQCVGSDSQLRGWLQECEQDSGQWASGTTTA